jgi:hypothetical protein
VGDQGLRDEVLPLFASADDRDGMLRPELVEPAVELAPITRMFVDIEMLVEGNFVSDLRL